MHLKSIHLNVRVYIGEFSASRYCGPLGDHYISDLIGIFEKYKWSWSYHSYREAKVWDPKISISDLNNNLRSANTPRIRLLEKYFKMK